MANRHSNKKHRAAIRKRIAHSNASYTDASYRGARRSPATHDADSHGADSYPGDSYQKARQRRSARREYAPERDLDGFELTEFTYFGKPATLATWMTQGAPAAILLSETMRRPLLWTRPLFWFGRRGLW